MRLGCNKASGGFLSAPNVAIGAVKLQRVTSGRWTVAAGAAGLSPVVPAHLINTTAGRPLRLRCTQVAQLDHCIRLEKASFTAFRKSGNTVWGPQLSDATPHGHMMLSQEGTGLTGQKNFSCPEERLEELSGYKD